MNNIILVGVLGCGPSGLLAAHAVSLAGFVPIIFSKKTKSRIGGAQYLHGPIPHMTPRHPEGELKFEMRGDADTYSRKVYGMVRDTSWNVFRDGTVPAWSLTSAYDRLWAEYEGVVQDCTIDAEDIPNLSTKVDLLVSTVPLKFLCSNPHAHYFQEQEIWIHNAPILPELARSDENKIIYNGIKEMSWYRSSKIFGAGSTEWNINRKPPLPNLVRVKKPLKTNCNCWPNVVKLGRYGKWQKGVLSHHAFLETAVALNHYFQAEVPGVDVREAV